MSSKTTRRKALAGGLAVAAAAAAAPQAARARDAWADTTYQRYELAGQRGIASLQRNRRQARSPGTGEVLVRMRAAALNYRDLLLAAGQYGEPQPAERVPLSDGAGEVLAVGDGVTGLAPGDRVTAPHFLDWLAGDFSPAIFANDAGITTDGWLSELVWLPARSVVRLPERLSFETAAALGVAGITAWRVLQTLGQIKAGDTVLTLGTGGVSIMALQIARMNGARVAITSSSDDKLALARDLGAEITVNYRQEPEWQNAVRAATGGRGVDIVVETVGVATLEQSIAACAPNARVGLLGVLGGIPEQFPNLLPLYGNNIHLQGITSGSRAMHANLLEAASVNQLEPYVDKVFDFADAQSAYAHLKAAGHVGKVLITSR